MSRFSEIVTTDITRRDFIARASALTGFCLLNCDAALSQQSDAPRIARALDDKNVIRGKVTYKSGNGEIDGYLSRPNGEGSYPIVIVVPGNTYDEEYIQNTTAMLAQQGFVGISPNILSLQKDSMTADEKRKVFAEQITDERIFQDIQASIDYLKKQKFAKKKRFGIMGFCFGGRCALMFASVSKEIASVAPFYGNLRTPTFANRKQDPLDIQDKIKVPVQGHYSMNDSEIPVDQLRTFEDGLKKHNTKVEIFTYDAPHGFFAYTRKSYNTEAARLSWERTVEFFKQNLGK